MGFWERAQNLDRRIIYVILVSLMILVQIRPIGLAIDIKSETRAAFNNIEKLPAGSIVWISADFGATNTAELMPAEKAVLRHLLRRNLRVIAGGMWDQAGVMTDTAWQEVKNEFPDKKYGVDFVNVGYKPGSEVLLERIVTDAHQALLGMDFYGKAFSELPLMSEFKTFKDAKLIFEFIAGTPGENEYIKMVTDKLGIPFCVSAVAVSVPGIMPLVQSGQIQGMLAGMAGSAEYEVLIQKPGPAVAGMDTQSIAHLTMVVFIIFGNIGYLVLRAAKGKVRA